MSTRSNLAGLTPAVFVAALTVLGCSRMADSPGDDPTAGDAKKGDPAVEVLGPMGEYEGKLTEVNVTSLVLRATGREPRRFILAPWLAAGGIQSPYQPGPHVFPAGTTGPTRLADSRYMYRVQDVRIGDILRIVYYQDGGNYICDNICIHRRPGGRVPPTPGKQRSYSRHEYHNVVSALGELEEKGLPRPDYFPPDLPPEERNPNAKSSPE